MENLQMNLINDNLLALAMTCVEAFYTLYMTTYMCVYIVRLLNAFAEEQATEDAVYYMGEALRKGVVDLDVFLKVNALNSDLF